MHDSCCPVSNLIGIQYVRIMHGIGMEVEKVVHSNVNSHNKFHRPWWMQTNFDRNTVACCAYG